MFKSRVWTEQMKISDFKGLSIEQFFAGQSNFPGKVAQLLCNLHIDM